MSYLYKISNENPIIIRENKRKEYRFGEMLNKLTGLKWDTQCPIPNQNNGFYRLDFKYKNILIVEYDEKRHTYDSIYDNEKKRIDYCINWLSENETNGYKIPVIRIEEEFELEGLHKIIKFLIGNKII